ncbi:unnamed protein product [Allacma fusca]|uniref:Uncharacterized protein n=1 Tax=Allacma fusca TaxID=39272 RepID=A0A8J2PXF3_9HEXA|nr:unnamed protein product [Allacma fusca]
MASWPNFKVPETLVYTLIRGTKQDHVSSSFVFSSEGTSDRTGFLPIRRRFEEIFFLKLRGLRKDPLG